MSARIKDWARQQVGLEPESQYERQRQWWDKGPATTDYQSDMRDRSGALGNAAENMLASRPEASRQYRQGLRRAADANMAMASGGGAAAGRAATYATDQMKAVGNARAEQMDLQEQMQREQMLLSARQRQVGGEQMQRDDATRRFLGDLGHNADMYNLHQQQSRADDEFYKGIVGTVLGGASSLASAGAMSDEDNKFMLLGNGLDRRNPYIDESTGEVYDPPTAGTTEPEVMRARERLSEAQGASAQAASRGGMFSFKQAEKPAQKRGARVEDSGASKASASVAKGRPIGYEVYPSPMVVGRSPMVTTIPTMTINASAPPTDPKVRALASQLDEEDDKLQGAVGRPIGSP